MIIGITGTDGAGKGTVVDYLVTQHGFTHYSSRDLIVAEIERQGLPVDRNQMRLTANELRERYGNEFVVKTAMEKALAAGQDRVVIESVRALAEAEYLKAHRGILLAIDADPKVRYERVQARRSATDQVTFEQFLAHEELEKNDPNPHGMQKAKVMAMADHHIDNTKTVSELKVLVDAVLSTLTAPSRHE
jgi:dephospho-CoA kinase